MEVWHRGRVSVESILLGKCWVVAWEQNHPLDPRTIDLPETGPCLGEMSIWDTKLCFCLDWAQQNNGDGSPPRSGRPNLCQCAQYEGHGVKADCFPALLWFSQFVSAWNQLILPHNPTPRLLLEMGRFVPCLSHHCILGDSLFKVTGSQLERICCTMNWVSSNSPKTLESWIGAGTRLQGNWQLTLHVRRT